MRADLPVTRHFFLFVYTLSQVFVCLVFIWRLPAGAIRRRTRALPPTVSQGGGSSLRFRDKPSIRTLSTVCEQPRQGSPELAWLPGFVSLAAAHALSAARALGIRPHWCWEGLSPGCCPWSFWYPGDPAPPGRTLSLGPLRRFSAEDAQVCVYLLLVKRVVLMVSSTP